MLDGFLTLYRGYVIINENENKQTNKQTKQSTNKQKLHYLDIPYYFKVLLPNVRTHKSVIIAKEKEGRLVRA